MVMKSAEDGRRYNATHVLDRAMDRSVGGEHVFARLDIGFGNTLRHEPFKD